MLHVRSPMLGVINSVTKNEGFCRRSQNEPCLLVTGPAFETISLFYAADDDFGIPQERLALYPERAGKVKAGKPFWMIRGIERQDVGIRKMACCVSDGPMVSLMIQTGDIFGDSLG